MAKVAISIGSNLGDKFANVRGSVKHIAELERTELLSVSSLYKTEPVGYEPQEDFINMAVVIDTELEPYELLEQLQQIEQDFKRERTIPNGPRTLDLDIISYEGVTIDEPKLTIPHPRMNWRRFALEPLAEIAPELEPRDDGKTIETLLKDCEDDSSVVLIEKFE